MMPGRSFTVTLLIAATVGVQEIDDFVQSTMTERHLPGVSLAVARNGRILKHAAYGQTDIEHGGAITVSTILPVLSVAKSFTAVAVMMLMEDGKLRLDDRIANHLPDLPAAWQAVTIRQCLTHTAGMRSFERVPGYFEEIQPTNPSRSDLIKRLAPLPLDSPPGERWSYNNTAYVLLAGVVEKASGQTYPEFLQKRIFDSAHLSSTGIPTRKTPPRSSIRGYTWRDSRFVEIPRAYPLNVTLEGVGALESTSGDLMRFIAALVEGQLLRRSSLDQMWSTAKLNDGSDVKTIYGSYALGWWVSEHLGHRMISAIGGPGLGGFASVSYFPDNQLTVVLLTNSDAASFTSLGISREIAGRYLTK